MIVLNKVCYRAVRRIIANRTNDVPDNSLSIARKEFKNDVIFYAQKLDRHINGYFDYGEDITSTDPWWSDYI